MSDDPLMKKLLDELKGMDLTPEPLKEEVYVPDNLLMGLVKEDIEAKRSPAEKLVRKHKDDLPTNDYNYLLKMTSEFDMSLDEIKEELERFGVTP